MHFVRTLLLLLLLGVSPWAGGTEPRVAAVGDPAPPLQVGRWIQGGPVDLAAQQGKRVVVIAFWATWSAPCRVALPFLDDLEERLRSRGVAVVGISTEPIATVTELVRLMRSQVEFAVAVDDNGRTSSRYMQAFGLKAVPHVFVVDLEGRIVWHGAPGTELERVVVDVLDGKHDLAAAQRADRAGRLVRRYFERSLEGEEPEALRALGDQVLQEAAQDQDVLNEFAWILLTDARLPKRDLDLATRAARLAYEVSGRQDAAIIDTYARALFDTGLRREAIELQRAAIAAAADPKLRQELESTLRGYEKAERGKKI